MIVAARNSWLNPLVPATPPPLGPIPAVATTQARGTRGRKTGASSNWALAATGKAAAAERKTRERIRIIGIPLHVVPSARAERRQESRLRFAQPDSLKPDTRHPRAL